MTTVKKKEVAVVEKSDNLPSYIKQTETARGSENVGAEDLVIPRIEIVQSLSPARKKKDPGYIEGAEEGMLFNSLTRELYGTELMIVPVMFKKEYLVWKDRDDGGGFRGAFSNKAEAEARTAEVKAEETCEAEATETAQHFVMIGHADGRIEEAVLSMSRTKLKVSRALNSLIRLNEGDRFSRVYRLGVVEETNSKNQSFFNYSISNVGFPVEAVYNKAEGMYESVNSGEVNVEVDRSVEGETAPETEEGSEY